MRFELFKRKPSKDNINSKEPEVAPPEPRFVPNYTEEEIRMAAELGFFRDPNNNDQLIGDFGGYRIMVGELGTLAIWTPERNTKDKFILNEAGLLEGFSGVSISKNPELGDRAPLIPKLHRVREVLLTTIENNRLQSLKGVDEIITKAEEKEFKDHPWMHFKGALVNSSIVIDEVIEEVYKRILEKNESSNNFKKDLAQEAKRIINDHFERLKSSTNLS